MSGDVYHELLIEEAKNPQNFGRLNDPDAEMRETNASCGDTVEVYIRLSKDQKQIEKIKWQGDGCIISRVAMSQLSQLVEGMAVKDVRSLAVKDVLKELELTNISPGRIKCVQLGLLAVKKALNDFNRE